MRRRQMNALRGQKYQIGFKTGPMMIDGNWEMGELACNFSVRRGVIGLLRI